MNIQTLLESSNQYKQVADDAKRLASKWVKSGLLEGIKTETERNTMAMLLENQAKQLVTEANVTGGTLSMSGGGYNSENWAGVALPLVRRVFGEIAAKEFVSVQPMNLPSGLVFYLDFKYGTNVNPFRVGDSLYSATPNTNVTDFVNTSSLYEAGRFNYSVNNLSASVTFFTASVTGGDLNQDTTYTSGSCLKIVTVLGGGITGSADLNAVRSFVISGSVSGSLFASDVLQQFTKLSGSANQWLVFVTTGSSAAGPTGGSTTLFYSNQPAPNTRGDFEDTAFNVGTPGIAIPEITVNLKSEAIVA
jgi:hypothetical protein